MCVTWQLVEMGFAEVRAKKGLMYGNGNDLENAVNWLMDHQVKQEGTLIFCVRRLS